MAWYTLNLALRTGLSTSLIFPFSFITTHQSPHTTCLKRPFRLPSYRAVQNVTFPSTQGNQPSQSARKPSYALLKSIKAFSILLFFPQRALYISFLIRFHKCETIKIKVLVHFRENHQTHNYDVLMRCFILYHDEIRRSEKMGLRGRKLKSGGGSYEENESVNYANDV